MGKRRGTTRSDPMCYPFRFSLALAWLTMAGEVGPRAEPAAKEQQRKKERPNTVFAYCVDPREKSGWAQLFERRAEGEQREGVLISCRFAMDSGCWRISVFGSEEEYTEKEMVVALQTFYQGWKAGESGKPPRIVGLKDLPWPSPSDLGDGIKELCEKYSLGAWLMNGVLDPDVPQHPTKNDRRLGEILKKQREEKKGK